MTPSSLTHQVSPADETIPIGPLTIRFLLTGANSNGTVAMFELHVSAKAGLPGPAHSHDHYEETFYGVSGILTLTVGGNQIEVGRGETFCIPRGAVHRFENKGDDAAMAVCVITPAKLGPEYFREVAELLKQAGGAPPDRAKAAEIMRRHGLTPAAPQA